MEGWPLLIFSRLRQICTVSFGNNPPGSPPQTLLTMYKSCISGCMWIFQNFGLARPDHRMGGWRWRCHCSSLTIFPRALNSLWEVFAAYFFILRCCKPKILGKNYRIASQKFFTEVTKACLWLQFLIAECFDQSIWCLGLRNSSARGQKSAPCLSQICAGPPRAGCKEGQAHPHVSPSTSSPLPAVPAQGFPGPEAGFVFLCFTAHSGLFFHKPGWAFQWISGIQKHGVAVCFVPACVCAFTYFLFSPHLAEWETKQKTSWFCLFPITRVTLSHSSYWCCVLCKPRASQLLRAIFSPFA